MDENKTPCGRLIKLDFFTPDEDILGCESKEKVASNFKELFTEGDVHEGGSGRVEKVSNANGKTFYALKTPLSNSESAVRSFSEEIKNTRILSKQFGFPSPTFYGHGAIDGKPAFVLEWVDGETIVAASDLKSEDPLGKRVTPRLVAQLGISILGIVERLSFEEGAFVHRDISAKNIMLRTNKRSVKKQVQDESFDLCIIDFGSATLKEQDASPGITMVENLVRKGTPEYAAPEMLTSDIKGNVKLRTSPKVDSYAVCSILYELLSGVTPYNLAGMHRLPPSFYRYKMDTPIPHPVTLHDFSSIADICRKDCYIAGIYDSLDEKRTAKHSAITNISDAEFDNKFSLALAKADYQLGAILLKGLNAQQENRVGPRELRAMLVNFVKNYEQNIRNAINGMPLVPFLDVDQQALITTRSQSSPIVLHQADDTPLFLPDQIIINNGPDVVYLDEESLEKAKKEHKFNKLAFGIGLAICSLVGIIFSLGLNGSLYQSGYVGNELQISGLPSLGFLAVIFIPLLFSTIVFLACPKNGIDIAAGTLATIASTFFALNFVGSFEFVSDYVKPLFFAGCLAVSFGFVVCMCCSRKQL
ncbi:MAG: protein kinase [Phoenicibacter congonensis]|uniref:Protein kinase n=1 Tax=Phoenicibacter congonensis TaxID=1944646 RepID=A0AA43RHE9_9ACTN|nr:protein kinase [Phoenicibacter congonensis]